MKYLEIVNATLEDINTSEQKAYKSGCMVTCVSFVSNTYSFEKPHGSDNQIKRTITMTDIMAIVTGE